MKKQINPTIKAHLLRSALYLLLLVAVCAIPFALAQRNAAKRSLTKPVARANVAATMEDLPRATGPVTLPDAASGIVPSGNTGAPQLAPQVVTLSSGTTGANPVRTLLMPLYPHVILYDQYDNFDAIEVPFTDAIPSDFDGLMGVPITFLDKYNPEQFEITGYEYSDKLRTKNYPVQIQVDKKGKKSNVKKLNDVCALRVDRAPSNQTYYIVNGEYFVAPYKRLFIRHPARPARRTKK